MARSIRRTGRASCRGLMTGRSGFGTRRQARRSASRCGMRARSRRGLFAGRQAHPVVVSDKTLRLWDAATGAAIGEPLRHEDLVMARSIRRTASASCRGLKTRRCGFGTRRRGRRSASRCGMRTGQRRGLFAGRQAHPIVVFRQDAAALGRGDGGGDRRAAAARGPSHGRGLFAGRQAHPIVVF